MCSHYKRRIENHILEILTDLLAREVRDPRAEDVVVTAVSLNEDSSVARVFYMGGTGNVQHGLDKASKFLRGEVGRFLKMRTAPELRFEEDHSLDRYNRIESVLDENPPLPVAEEAEDGGDEGEGS